MLDMNLQRFSANKPPRIPNGLPDKPGPKLVSAKGNVEHLVVVLENDDNLKAATKRVLDDGNVPAVAVHDFIMTWGIDCYIGFYLESDTKLLVVVGKFDDQGHLNTTTYIATVAKKTNG